MTVLKSYFHSCDILVMFTYSKTIIVVESGQCHLISKQIISVLNSPSLCIMF